MPKKSLVGLGMFLLFCNAGGLGCDDDEKDYTCDGAVERMYDVGCELWCVCDLNGDCNPYTCGWYDDGAVDNFTQSEAKSVCAQMEVWAEDEGCTAKLQHLLNCLVHERRDNCAENCEDEAGDFWDCAL